MKGVMANVPEHLLEWRRRTGADLRVVASGELEPRIAGREDTRARLP